MPNYRKFRLLLAVFIIPLMLNAQRNFSIDQIETGNKWDQKISEIKETEIKTRYLTNKNFEKAKSRIQKDIDKAATKFKSDPENQEYYDHFFLVTTNASIWYSQVTSKDFQIFLKRLVTGRPISKDVILDVKNSYVKWVRKPTLKNLEHYSQTLHNTGRSYEILTRLQVSTNGMTDVQVKYMELTNGIVETLNGETVTKTVPVGNYYVWLESEGIVVSDNTNGYPCITSSKNIVLNTR